MNEVSPSPDALLSDVKPSGGVVDWKPAFLKALENVGVVKTAARLAGVSVMTVWREKKANPDFAKAYEASLECGARTLEEEAVRRAVHGVRRLKFNPKTGEPYIDPATGEPYVELEFSDSILIAFLRRHFPEYRDKSGEVHVSTTLNNIAIFTEDKQREWQERHREALM
jgi:hypothetical protein